MPFWSRRCPPTTGGQGGTSSREKAHLVKGKSAPHPEQGRASSRARARLVKGKRTPFGCTGTPLRGQQGALFGAKDRLPGRANTPEITWNFPEDLCLVILSVALALTTESTHV